MAAVSALPPLPAGVWLGGTLLVVVIGAVRVFRSQRRLSRAYPPAESVQRMTTEIAETLGLRRVPEVLMVDAAVSPMIWCGRRARLMLPGRLWDELDDPGRRAVLCHELAHLRRRDHQVRWVELLVAAVYWWHPVVWWVRRRLQEEADLCCDAWVTWLMPQGRRAYAEALLQTKRYVNDNTMPVPAVGMAMTSRRARSFARRLTMLMTSSCKPKLSASGVVLAVALATACWMATPAQSSPLPDKPAAAEAPEVPAVPVFLVSGDDDNLEKRMKRLEKRMDKLTDKLDSLLDALGDGKHDGDQKGKAKLKQRSKTAPRAPRPPRPPRPSKGDRTRIRAPEMKIEFEGSKGESVVRAYELPPGKLGALTELMVRDDVPVLVEPGEEAIKVHGTAWQHATFEAFVDMIHASDRPAKLRKGELVDRAYKLTGGKLEALTGLMVRDDVPILVQPMAEALGVHATEAHQEIFEAFVDLIHPSGAAPPPRSVAETTKGEVVVRTYALPEEKLDILTELMVREDVPVLVRPVEGGIEVHGTKDQQAVFEAFVNMVHPTGGKAKGQKARRGGGAWLEALKSGAGEELRQQLKVKAAERARAEAEAQVRSAAMAKQAHASEAATGVATAQFEVDVLETQIKQNRNRARMLDEEARRLQKRAQKLATEAKEFEDQARALDDEANGS